MEIGEFGVGRPDFGGRWPRGEALGQKKKGYGARPALPRGVPPKAAEQAARLAWPFRALAATNLFSGSLFSGCA